MPHWSYYGPRPEWKFNGMTDCKWDGKIEEWYGSDLYVGDPLSPFAASLMKFMTATMNESDHWVLYENLYTGDTLDSLLSIGRKNAFYQVILFMLLGLCILPVYIFIVALWRRNKPSTRTKDQITWIWLATIPLFILTLIVGTLFTIPIWKSHSTIQSNDNARFAIDKIKNIEEQQLWMGQCELDNLENKFATSKQAINQLAVSYSKFDCSIEELLKRRMDSVATDLETIKEVGKRSTLLKVQLEDLIEKGEQSELEKESLNRALDVLEKHENNLKILEKALTDAEAKIAVHYNKTIVEKSQIIQKSQKAVTSYETSADNIFARFKKVKESLDAAVNKLAQFTKTVSQRFQRIQKEIHERDPLGLYVFMQVIAATGAITSMICLSLGFIALACIPIFPKASLINFVRQLLTFGFLLLVAASFFCFLFGAIIMIYTVPITSVCDTLTDVASQQALQFHETIGTKFSLTNVAGQEIPISFGRFISSAGYESLATKKGNQYADLFHTEDLSYLNQWQNFKDKNMPILKLEGVKIPAHPEALKSAKQYLSDLEKIQFSKGSQETREFRDEITILRSLLSQLDFSLFKELNLPNCRQDFRAMAAHDSKLKDASPAQAIQKYQDVMMTELHYQATKFAYIYLGGAPGDLCVELRIPLSGTWLLLLLLGGLLMLNLMVLWNIIDYLKTEIVDNLKMNPSTSVDFVAPLLGPETDEK